MINIKPQIYDLLKTIPNVKVDYFYPQDFAKLPAISYYEVSNTTAVKSDGVEYSSEIHMQIDIWTLKSSATSDLALQVDEIMTSKGFYREMAMDLYEQATKIYHKTMRYRGIVNNKTFMVTK